MGWSLGSRPGSFLFFGAGFGFRGRGLRAWGLEASGLRFGVSASGNVIAVAIPQNNEQYNNTIKKIYIYIYNKNNSNNNNNNYNKSSNK